jgi:hypothetical protein
MPRALRLTVIGTAPGCHSPEPRALYSVDLIRTRLAARERRKNTLSVAPIMPDAPRSQAGEESVACGTDFGTHAEAAVRAPADIERFAPPGGRCAEGSNDQWHCI